MNLAPALFLGDCFVRSSHTLVVVRRYLQYNARFTQSSTQIPEFKTKPEVLLDLLVAAEFLNCWALPTSRRRRTSSKLAQSTSHSRCERRQSTSTFPSPSQPSHCFSYFKLSYRRNHEVFDCTSYNHSNNILLHKSILTGQ